MNKIELLNSKKKFLTEQVAQIESKIQKEYDNLFDNDALLQSKIRELECSEQYCESPYGEIMKWARVECLGNVRLEEREYLDNYLNDQGCYANYENDTFFEIKGYCIIIDRQGDVYDQQNWKLIISFDSYFSEACPKEKRNAVIEEYMQKTGHFPGVFKIVDGDVTLVDTRPKNA